MLPPASTFLFSGAGEHFPAQMSSEEHRGWSSDAIPASQTRAEWRSIQRSSGRSRHPGSVKEREYREDDESFGCRAGGAVRAVHRGENGEAEVTNFPSPPALTACEVPKATRQGEDGAEDAAWRRGHRRLRPRRRPRTVGRIAAVPRAGASPDAPALYRIRRYATVRNLRTSGGRVVAPVSSCVCRQSCLPKPAAEIRRLLPPGWLSPER